MAILGAVLFMAGPGITQGGLGWSDAPNHVFDGVFVLEFFKAWPIGHARQWAEDFYLRYPALGIIVFYPPGFAVVEAIVFAILGVNVLAARLTVLVFVVGAGWLMYLLGRRWFDRPTGLFAALLLITSPQGVLWANDVMLEWPATFWILAAVYCYERDRTAPNARGSPALAATLVMAFMTKQTAGFIFPVLLIHSVLQERGGRYLAHPARGAALGAAAAVIAAYVLLTRSFAAHSGALMSPSFSVGEAARWAPEILGWPLLPLAALGIAGFLARPNRGPRGLLLLWFGAWTVICLSIAAKEPRYFFFSLPPLMFAAAAFMTAPSPPDAPQPRRAWATERPRLLLLALLVIAQVALARAADRGRLHRYDAAVAELARRADADVVLVDAVRDGQFIFDLYQNDQAKTKIIPLRGSKILYARPGRAKWGVQSFVQAPRDVLAQLDQLGIRYIVVESRALRTDETDADRAPRELLRQLLHGDSRFTLVRSWPLDSGDPVWNGVALELYEYSSCPPRTSKTIRLSIPAMNRDVEFRLP